MLPVINYITSVYCDLKLHHRPRLRCRLHVLGTRSPIRTGHFYCTMLRRRCQGQLNCRYSLIHLITGQSRELLFVGRKNSIHTTGLTCSRLCGNIGYTGSKAGGNMQWNADAGHVPQPIAAVRSCFPAIGYGVDAGARPITSRI
jgi:hypothetical protein